MKRVVVFGNSGSGKSTLAKALSKADGLVHLDLDTLAWLPTDPPQRAPIPECRDRIDEFTAMHDRWVIEGCYADLIEIAAARASEMVFLNLAVEDCLKNAHSRPWEPHKYPTREEQDANLEMLATWIRAYPEREDSCSLSSHMDLYDRFQGKKRMETRNSGDR